VLPRAFSTTNRDRDENFAAQRSKRAWRATERASSQIASASGESIAMREQKRQAKN
jgi:hypothetical protein